MGTLNVIAISLIPRPLLMMNMMQIRRSTSSNIEQSVPLRLRSFTGFSTENEKRLHGRINHDGDVNVFVSYLWTSKTLPFLRFLKACPSTTMTQHSLTSCNLALGIALPCAKSLGH